VLGAVHITGGGLVENIPRVLEKGYNARLFASKWPLPAMMRWMKAAGNVKDFEFAKTFNCGLGMVLLVEDSNVDTVMNHLRNFGEEAYEVGYLTRSREGTEGGAVELLETEVAWSGMDL
jgi:phosphoribosylaminoimidazole (AIR) synthetase